jgi:hypothetical protein
MSHAPIYRSNQTARRHITHRQQLLAAASVVGIVVSGAVLGHGPRLAHRVQAELGDTGASANGARQNALAAVHLLPAVGPVIARDIGPLPPAAPAAPAPADDAPAPGATSLLRRPLPPLDPIAGSVRSLAGGSQDLSRPQRENVNSQPDPAAAGDAAQPSNADAAVGGAPATSAADASPSQASAPPNQRFRLDPVPAAPMLASPPQVVPGNQSHGNAAAGAIQPLPATDAAPARAASGDDRGNDGNTAQPVAAVVSLSQTAPVQQQTAPPSAGTTQGNVPHITVPDGNGGGKVPHISQTNAPSATGQLQGAGQPASTGNDGPSIQISAPAAPALGSSGMAGSGTGRSVSGNQPSHPDTGGPGSGPPMSSAAAAGPAPAPPVPPAPPAGSGGDQGNGHGGQGAGHDH